MIKYKKQIFVVTLLVLFFIVAIFIITNKNELVNNNVNLKFNDDKKYSTLLFTSIGTRKDNLNHILLTIKNDTDKDFVEEYVYIHFYNEKKKDIGKIGFMIPNIDRKSKTDVDIVVKEKYMNAYTFTIEEK